MAGRDLHVEFIRKPETVRVVGAQLDVGRAQALAKCAKASQEEIEAWQRVLRDPTPALWVAVRPSEHVPALPSLQDIARLSECNLEEWAQFVGQYGLLEFDWKWAVAWLGEERIFRIPLSDLKETSARAVVLVAATKAALGYPSEFHELGLFAVSVFTKALDRKGPLSVQRPWKIRLQRIKGTEQPAPTKSLDPYEETKRALEESELRDPGEEARKIIALALEDALDQVEADVEPGDRGIPEKWGLYARGCWPLVVLSEFVHKDKRIRYKFTFCVAPGCSNSVPAGRGKYCCKTCAERAKKQKQRQQPKALAIRRA